MKGSGGIEPLILKLGI